MKKYYNYSNDDISRLSWKNSSTTKDYNPLNANTNKFKNDIFIQKNSFQSFKNKFESQLDLNRSVNNVNNLVNFNNDENRYNNMTQEIVNKDKELQKYKNEIYQLQTEINELQKERTEITTNQVEVKLLKEKLHEQYNLNKEIGSLHHDLKRASIQIKGQNETIAMLKKMIHKLRLDKYGADEVEEELKEEKQEEEDNEEYLFSDEEFKAQKKYFHNERLKRMIMKYNKQYSPRMVDELFIEMEIKPNIKITKALVLTIINYLREEE